MSEESIKLRLPNGTVLNVPKKATEQEIIEYSIAKDYMSRDEWLTYDDNKDALKVANYYAEVDATPSTSLGLPFGGDLVTQAVDEMIIKPSRKFGFAASVEPKTASVALPALGQTIGTGLAAGAVASAGVVSAPVTALALGVGAALGYFGGDVLKEQITGVNKEGDVRGGEALTEGLIEGGLAMAPPVLKASVEGAKTLLNKKVLGTEFADDIAREFSDKLLAKYNAQGEGLLTTQLGTPTAGHQALANIGYASIEGRQQINAVIEAQSEVIKDDLLSLLNMYGTRVEPRELGGMVLQVIDKQKELSGQAFRGLYKDRLGDQADTIVDVRDIKENAKAFINKLHRTTAAGSPNFVETLEGQNKAILSTDKEILNLRRHKLELKTNGAEPEELKGINEALEAAKIELDELKLTRDEFLKGNEIPFADREAYTEYQEYLKMPDSLPLNELNTINLRSKDRMREMAEVNPAKANSSSFGGLKKQQGKLEARILATLNPEQRKEYLALNEMYAKNSTLIHGDVISQMLKQGMPENVSYLMTQSGKTSPFIELNKLLDTNQTFYKEAVKKGLIDQSQLNVFKYAGQNLKQKVRREFLVETLQMSESVDGFDAIRKLRDKIKTQGRGEEISFKEILGQTRGIDFVEQLFKEYDQLVSSLPKRDGVFSLSVLSTQGAGIRQGAQEGVNVITGDPSALMRLTQAIGKYMVPNKIAAMIVDPQMSAKILRTTRKSIEEIKKGRRDAQVYMALSRSLSELDASIDVQDQSAEQVANFLTSIERTGEEEKYVYK